MNQVDLPEPSAETRQVLARLARMSPVPVHRLPVPIGRFLYEILAPRLDMPCPDVSKAEMLSIPGPGGRIRAEVVWPLDPPPGRAAAIVYFHGGGWVLGSIKTHARLCRYLANRTRAVVINVGYRLAPKHPFPAGLEDALAATRWVRQNAESLCIAANRIIVAGDSAGGNLATVVAGQLRAETPAIAGQVLIYPVTDLENERPSRLELDSGYFLERKAMRWFKRLYLQNAPATDPRASPILSEDLAGFPQTYILTAELDPLRDEGVEYADKLERAGNAITHRQWHGMIHGFLNMAGHIPEARLALDEIADWIRTVCRN